MIRPIDIRLNAAHPELPLAEAVTFTGSPSTVLIRGVPPNCGRWAITAVSVAATFPDGSTTTRAAVQSANGVWVATLPATARSGRTANGLRVMADGIDENGAAVTGYILGVADFAVASLGVTPAPEPGETSWQMLYFDAVPGTLRKGDVAKVDGVLKLYNGTAWEAFAGDIPSPSTATPAMDGTGAAGTSAAFARGDHVHPTDTSRVPTSRTINGVPLSSDVTLTGADIPLNPSTGALDMNSAVNLLTTQVDNAQMAANVAGVAATAANNKIDAHTSDTTIHVTSTEKSTWNGKQSALSAQQLANIAAVPNKADASAIPYSLGTPTVIDTALSETVEGETVYYGAATLADRTANIVQVTAATALDELRITFPAATNGKVRDFGLRVEIGTGSAALAAPALVPVAPTGETIKIENNAKEIPALADGTATAKGVTLLYFSENAPGVFVVKGEQVEEVA